MKIDELYNMNESIIHVPSKWLNTISHLYMEPLKYLFIKEFEDDDILELSSEIDYTFNERPDLESLYSNPNKLHIIKDNIPLVDTMDETFIDDTSVMLVAKYDPNTSTGASYSNHPKHGHMIIINLAYPLADSDKSDNNSESIKHVERTLKELLEHELVHLIQHEKGDVRQLKKNKDYSRKAVGDRTEYFKSPIEFNAMLTSVIREIQRVIDELTQEQKTLLGFKNIQNGIRYFSGDTNSKYIPTGKESIDNKAKEVFLSKFEMSEFMQTLRDEKPTQWKKAIKTIMSTIKT